MDLMSTLSATVYLRRQDGDREARNNQETEQGIDRGRLQIHIGLICMICLLPDESHDPAQPQSPNEGGMVELASFPHALTSCSRLCVRKIRD
jgi:hypothetical protein